MTTELSRKWVRVKCCHWRERKSSKKELKIMGSSTTPVFCFYFRKQLYKHHCVSVCLFVANFLNLSTRRLLGPDLCRLVLKYNDKCVANTKDNYKWRVWPNPKLPTRLPQLPFVNCTSFIQIFACMHITHSHK